MKKTNIITLCLISICMSSCTTSPGNEPACLQTPNGAFPAMSMTTVLASLPPSAFGNTTEGITRQELDTLIQNLESDNWKVTDCRPNQLTIRCKRPNSTLHVYAYAMGTNAALITLTLNERATSAETWIYRPGNQAVSRKQLLPEISINDFYSKGDKVADPEIYNGNVIMKVRDDGTLVYDVYTWMEESLENKQKAFAITAVWDGKGFKIRRAKL